MKQKKLKLTPIRLVAIVLVSTFMAWIVYAASAATGTLVATSDKSSVTQGDTFTVTITSNTDAPITIAQAKVTFDPAKVSYQGSNYTGSPFTADSPDASQGSNYIVVSRYKAGGPYPSGSNLVARLTFKALTSSGSAAIGVAAAPDSKLYSADDFSNIVSSTTGTSVALASPTPPSVPTTPSPNPASPTKPTSSSSSATTPKRTTTPTNTNPATTDTTIDPNLMNPVDTTSNYEQAGTTVQPGTSKVAKETLAQKVAKTVKLVAPFLVAGFVIGGLAWFGFKKLQERPMGFNPTPSAPGVGSVKPAGLTTTPAPKSPVDSKDDGAPKTFSGV